MLRSLDYLTDPDLEIKLGSFHEMHRVSDDGKLIFDFVAQFTQSREVPLDRTMQIHPRLPSGVV